MDGLRSSQGKEDAVKNVALVVGLLMLAFGAVGIVEPSALTSLVPYAVTSGAFYVFGAVRVALGLVLISVASRSRAPRALRIVGYFILVAGIATALTGLVAIERARAIIDWWLQQGSPLLRLTAAVVAALGGLIAYACAPGRRAASR
jgi:uncharacterized membrane protein